MPRKSSRSSRRSSRSMPPRSSSARNFLNFVAWLTGLVVSFAIGFAMIGGTLTVPWWLGGTITSVIAGWVVIIATFAGIITAIFGK